MSDFIHYFLGSLLLIEAPAVFNCLSGSLHPLSDLQRHYQLEVLSDPEFYIYLHLTKLEFPMLFYKGKENFNLKMLRGTRFVYFQHTCSYS